MQLPPWLVEMMRVADARVAKAESELAAAKAEQRALQIVGGRLEQSQTEMLEMGVAGAVGQLARVEDETPTMAQRVLRTFNAMPTDGGLAKTDMILATAFPDEEEAARRNLFAAVSRRPVFQQLIDKGRRGYWRRREMPEEQREQLLRGLKSRADGAPR